MHLQAMLHHCCSNSAEIAMWSCYSAGQAFGIPVHNLGLPLCTGPPYMPHYGVLLPVLCSLPFPSLPFPSLPFPSLPFPLPCFFSSPFHSLIRVFTLHSSLTYALIAGLSCNNSAVTVATGLTHGIAVAEQKAPEQDRTSNGAAPEGLAGTIQHMTHWPQTLIVGCSCVSSCQLHWVISWRCHDKRHAGVGVHVSLPTCVGVAHSSQLTWLGHLLVVVSSM